jgi:hypothetical protein
LEKVFKTTEIASFLLGNVGRLLTTNEIKENVSWRAYSDRKSVADNTLSVTLSRVDLPPNFILHRLDNAVIILPYGFNTLKKSQILGLEHGYFEPSDIAAGFMVLIGRTGIVEREVLTLLIQNLRNSQSTKVEDIRTYLLSKASSLPPKTANILGNESSNALYQMMSRVKNHLEKLDGITLENPYESQKKLQVQNILLN